MKIELEFPDRLRPLIERLRATNLYIGDDGKIIGQLAIRSLRDIFERQLIAEQDHRETGPADAHVVQIDEAAEIARAGEIMRRLDEEEAEHVEEPRKLWRRPGGLTDAQAAVHSVLHDAKGEKLAALEIAKRAGVSKGSITWLLHALEKAGLAHNAGIVGNPHWIVASTDAIAPEPASASAAPAPKRGARATPFRRFTDVKELDPENVNGLAADHPAVLEGRTLFPTTVVDPRNSNRLLVSGGNSRKIGDRVTKGPWAGMPIYTLTLEERASCPSTCFHWQTCFGNGMPLARRHRHGQDLIDYLRAELRDLQNEYPEGFVVRLHVLGDFWSVDYVAAWAGFLRTFPALRVFGYTAHERGSEIGAALKRITDKQWDRFAIRFSSAMPKPQGATTIFRKAEADNVPEGIVCPMQTGKTDCCGTCGLCWSEAAKDKTIVFMAHGRVGGKPGPRKARAPEDPAPLQSPARLRTIPRASKPAPKPMTSDDPAVKEWLERNGGPRTFEPGASGAPWNLALFLKDRGIEVKQKGLGSQIAYIVGNKKLGYLGLLALVNEYREREGLEPITAQSKEPA